MSFRNQVTRFSQLIADSITGALFQTSATGQRIVIDDTNHIYLYSGDPDEVSPAEIFADIQSGNPILKILGPDIGTPAAGKLQYVMLNEPDAGSTHQKFRRHTFRGELFRLEGMLGDFYIRLSTDSSGVPKGITATNLDFDNSPSGDVLTNRVVADELDMRNQGTTVGLSGFDFGAFSGTTDANGDVIITHDLGVVPVSVQFQPELPFGFYRLLTASLSTTQFKIRCAATTGVVFGAGQAVSGRWVALA